MRIISVLIFTVILTIASMPEASAATKPQVVCLNSKGKIIVRIGRCKAGQTRLTLDSLATNSVSLATDLGIKGPQGPQGLAGPKGNTGAVGAAGNPAGFDVGGCYPLSSPSQAFDYPANTTITKALSCNSSNGQQDFLLSSSFITLSPSNPTKPFIQSKLLNFDLTDVYPVGVTYTSRQAVIVGSQGHQLGISIVCCPR